MAIGQALSWRTYVQAVRSQGLGPLAPVAAVALFAGEVLTTAGLVVNAEGIRVPTAVLGVAVTAAWSAVALNAFVRRRHVPNCACFGRFFRQELRWWVLLEDAAFVAAASWHLARVVA